MGLQPLIRLIRQKVCDGRLPQNTFSRVSGRVGNNETCVACDGLIARNLLVIEGIDDTMTAVQFHVDCFYYWNADRTSQARSMAAGAVTGSLE
jgi:hypothetical protein